MTEQAREAARRLVDACHAKHDATFHYEQAPPKRAAGAPHGIAIRIEVRG
jgi:hypothetical protein